MSYTPGAKRLNDGTNFTKTVRHDTYPEIAPEKQYLSGIHVLITGASKGVGRATALSFAKAGAAVIVIAARSDLRSLEASIGVAAAKAGKAKPRVVSLSLDVTSRNDVEAAAKQVEGDIGHLDIIINNAGFLEKFVTIADSDPDMWWKSWEVNMLGPYLIVRSFLPLLLKSPNPHKTIVGASSVAAHFCLMGASAYQTGKVALLRLSEHINFEYGDQGVVAYCIHPGSVETELALGGLPEEMHKLLVDKAEMTSDTLVVLTSERRDWLAGRYVSCNWDMPEFLSLKDEIVKGDLLKVRMAVGDVH